MIARLAALFCLAAAPLAAQDLPDLQGREVVVA
ncbi:MAG TPA: basic amino acid ABC transporter substrate-binding protein, partial [Citreicella sp.]|nr:basic amino acid ABC transporter substrate-binding protein [Citreicella sp.]